MKISVISILFISLMSFLSQSAYATTILYNTTNVIGNTWEYAYTVSNDTVPSDINEVVILFDYGLYENIGVVSSPSDWDTIAVQPDLIFDYPDNGYADSLALVSGITPGSSLSGLTISFDWIGSDTPGAQSFEILDPNTFDIVDSGNTAPAPVPEPATLLLLGTGLLSMAGIGKKIRA